MSRTIIIGSMLALAACNAATTQQTVAAGQLFCATATATGPLVVALAALNGAPVIVTNKAQAEVQAACALIGAIPVSPPANPAQAPVVAALVSPLTAAKTTP